MKELRRGELYFLLMKFLSFFRVNFFRGKFWREIVVIVVFGGLVFFLLFDVFEVGCWRRCGEFTFIMVFFVGIFFLFNFCGVWVFVLLVGYFFVEEVGVGRFY